MKQTLAALAFAIALLYGCKKDDSSTSAQNPPANYFPLEVGRSWTYNSSGTQPNGWPDSQSYHAVVARVLQMNQSIGGQPNATIVQTTDENNQTNNLVFHAEPGKLWAYFPPSASYGSQVQHIYFYPGNWNTELTVPVGQMQEAFIQDYNHPGSSFEIRRQPDGNLVRATMISSDTLRIEGISLGGTSLALGRVGSLDTMTIMIAVADLAEGSGPAFTPWMPMWEASLSTADRDLYTWDSTFSFRRSNGTTLRDHITYHVTGHFVQYDPVSVAGSSITCEKHVLLMTVAETIDSISGGTTSPVFNGLSFQITGNLWVAAGIGFVKGDVSGTAAHNGRWVPIAMSGYVNGQGILQGSFRSPRMNYYCFDFGGLVYEYLSIDTLPSSPTGTSSFVLSGKNF